MSEYLSKRQAMEYLGLAPTSYRSIDQYIKAGLPVFIIGNKPRFSKKSIDAFMDDHKKGGEASCK